MKWATIMLVWMVTGSLLLASDGAKETSKDYLTICRSPFCQTIHNAVNPPVIEIQSPNDTAVYYSATQNVSVTVSGGSPPYTCRYKIDSNSWNSFDCQDTKQVTFHQGSNLLTAEVVDSLGFIGVDSITFEVYIIQGMVGELNPLLGVGVALAITLIIMDCDSRENKRCRK